MHAGLPQGCMPSSDIFQGDLTKILDDFEDVIVYINSIVIFTKQIFGHHINRLAQIIHVKETFLASQGVDYLGYTLSSKGI
jgi:hypothetical protein